MPTGATPHHPSLGNLSGTGNNRQPKRLKANIVFVTLNVNGYAAPTSNMSGIDKWSTINRTISEHQIAILALQETHLDQTLLQDVQTCFRRRLEILTSQHPTNPCTSARVAFVINKELIRPREYRFHELIPGCAAALIIKWLENEETMLVNVYAPNTREEHVTFWDLIDTKRRACNLRRPGFVLGDFNVTEDKIN